MEKSEWISVKDRLPYKNGSSDIKCLVYDMYWGIIVRPYNEYHHCWDTEDGDDYYCHPTNGKITHWMQLPNEPEIDN